MDKRDETINGEDERAESHEVERETSRMSFLMLGLDFPPPPLFKDAMEKNIISQVPLFKILKKFDGESITEVVRLQLAWMRYNVTRLSQWFTKNNFFIEKNPTLMRSTTSLLRRIQLWMRRTPCVKEQLLYQLSQLTVRWTFRMQ